MPVELWAERQTLYPADTFTLVHESQAVLADDLMQRVLLRWNGRRSTGDDGREGRQGQKPGRQTTQTPVASPAPRPEPWHPARASAPAPIPAATMPPGGGRLPGVRRRRRP